MKPSKILYNVLTFGAILSFMLIFNDASATTTDKSHPEITNIRVWAPEPAAGALRELGAKFEEEHHNVKIHYEFAPSGALYIGVVQGVPPDILLSEGVNYQNKITDKGLADLYSNIAYDRLVFVTQCSSGGHIGENNFISYLSDRQFPLAIASPTLSTVGKATDSIFRGMYKNNLNAYKITDAYAMHVIGSGDVAMKLALNEAKLGVLYASQITLLRTEGVCVREIPLPLPYQVKIPLTAAVMSKSVFHYVRSDREILDKELVSFYRSNTGKRIFSDFGFMQVKP